MIQEIFLRKAFNIRKEYLNIRRNIDSYEENVRNLLNNLQSKAEDLNILKEKLDSNKINDPESAKNELLKIMIELEDDINQNDKYITNLNAKIEDLKEQEQSLFRDIKQRYPDINNNDIKKQVQDYITKLNLS
jgi:chromosome segregation ATPase